MKVFVVLSTQMDGYVLGVFSTEDRARACVLANPDHYDESRFEERIQSFDIDVEGRIDRV
jgi:hypothetical protein